MNCDGVYEALIENADGGDHPPALHVRRHLASCPRCSRLHAGLTRGREVLGTLPALNVPSDFFARLQGKIDRHEEARRRRQKLTAVGRRVGSAAAVGGMAFLLAWVTLNRFPTGPGAVAAGTGDELPSVTVVRPFARLVEGQERRLFDQLAAGVDGVAPVESAIVGDGRTPALRAGVTSGFHRWWVHAGGSEAGDRPVLYATPSWTFSGAPVSFRLVSQASPIAPLASR